VLRIDPLDHQTLTISGVLRVVKGDQERGSRSCDGHWMSIRILPCR
jgi:hypothetical protein